MTTTQAGRFGIGLRRMAGTRDEVGSVLEAVIVIPAALVFVFIAVQACLWAQAGSVVQAAATQGARAAGVTTGSLPAGIAEAGAVLRAEGGQIVSQASVDATVLPGDLVRVRVSATAESILPGFHLSVTAEEVGVRQEFRVTG